MLLIEAQANGLTCVMSEAVSEEAVVFPERVRRLSLDRDNIQWAGSSDGNEFYEQRSG